MTAALTFGGCNDANKRTDSTVGEAVSDMDNAAEDVEADATVIDCNARPTVTADGDSATAADPMAHPEP